MTDIVIYIPQADGVAPVGWMDGMLWTECAASYGWQGDPKWKQGTIYTVPRESMYYPIVHYEGKWGADITVEGKPVYLPDEQVCSSFCHGNLWESSHSGMASIKWTWSVISKIRLPASHGYYADNPASDEVAIRHIHQRPVWNLDTWQSETKANLPAIEAAGHKVEFAPDWATMFLADLLDAWGLAEPPVRIREVELDEEDKAAIALIRTRVRPINQEQPK